jgi:hypothetical protein
MIEPESKPELISALTTEHFVMQTASSSTISEASARSTLYVMALSSSMVALGFTSHSPEIFIPFVAAVVPVIFLLGLFTVNRLVDTAMENMQYLTRIAQIRRHYRSLGEPAPQLFSQAGGRWPEAAVVPSQQLGFLLTHMGTTAAMIAVINNFVAGAGTTLLAANLFPGVGTWGAVSIGLVVTLLLTAAFLVYQRWRFDLLPQAR